MKIAVTGKGGAGKTTLTVCMSRYLADRGRDVYLLDADPDANAALALGLGSEDHPQPLTELKDLIEERTGADSGYGNFFKLNPKVDDVPATYSVLASGVRLLRTGRVKKGGSGCMCPENAFLSAVLSHMFFADKAWVILDMEAGVEHLGRATAQGVDAMLVVVEPGRRSIHTAHEVAKLAADIGVAHVGAVLNKLRGDEAGRIERALEPVPVLGRFPYDEDVAMADLEGRCAYRGTDDQVRIVEGLLEKIEDFSAAEAEGGMKESTGSTKSTTEQDKTNS